MLDFTASMIHRNNTARIVLLAVSLGLLSLAAGATAWRIYEAKSQPVLEALILLPEAREIADFALTDQAGNPFSLEDFRGHWSVLFFGYTSCPDVCPNTLYQLKQARQLMQQQAAEKALPHIYLVSVDPERDTPEKLADYLKYFDPAFTGLTGADEQLKALAFQLGVAYFIEPHEAGDIEYTVDHSAPLLLLNPDGQLHGVLPAPHEATRVANDLLSVVH